MTDQENIIYCCECIHCFENRRSPTGYSCGVWGYDDFACSTEPFGFCHKAKAKSSSKPFTVNIKDVKKLKGD